MRAHWSALVWGLCVFSCTCSEQPPDSGPPPPLQAPVPPSRDATSAAEFVRLIEVLSDPGEAFISDNFISNETSYLQVAPRLAQHASKEAAYLGVGPEQNFSYIALTQPRVAFIIDIRRGNLLLHLLYKALFHLAEDRGHFLALLLGRPWQAETAATSARDLPEVLQAVRTRGPEEAEFEGTQAAVRGYLESLGLSLSTADWAEIRRAHRAFFDGQLELRFRLREHSTRSYPTLGSLLLTRGPAGESGSFLASAEGFSVVQRLQEEHRVIPVVGDFAGDHALRAVAAELRRRSLRVGHFYVSNVEQYLLAPEVWQRWMTNLEALPASDESLLIRAYLDQGKRHPDQLPGHRTATLLHQLTLVRTAQRDKRYADLWQITTEGVLQ